MRPGLTIFLLFFGIATLDAVGGGHWLRTGFWLAVAVLFLRLDRPRPAGRAN